TPYDNGQKKHECKTLSIPRFTHFCADPRPAHDAKRSLGTKINEHKFGQFCSFDRAAKRQKPMFSRRPPRKISHFARTSGTPCRKPKSSTLRCNDFGARPRKPLVQNPTGRAISDPRLCAGLPTPHIAPTAGLRIPAFPFAPRSSPLAPINPFCYLRFI